LTALTSGQPSGGLYGPGVYNFVPLYTTKKGDENTDDLAGQTPLGSVHIQIAISVPSTPDLVNREITVHVDFFEPSSTVKPTTGKKGK